ncbi:hypothetical protein [Aliirhizobium smilacinae]|uniref:Uncharacterized protein n=1 Tax=Aliirhizobium smilacinae TaxID=1395944 RepID=A0A5C4XEK2_9HYPH|nr:hypothetical protein [Rhizobium smilacinae]TNM60990.1 hypothetical protein FHP24_24700 [Rhizobium smilacinae]
MSRPHIPVFSARMSPLAARKGPAVASANACCELHVLRNVDQGEDYRDAVERVNATGLALMGSFLTAGIVMPAAPRKFYGYQWLALLVAGFFTRRNSLGAVPVAFFNDKKTPHVVIPCHVLFAEMRRQSTEPPHF